MIAESVLAWILSLGVYSRDKTPELADRKAEQAAIVADAIATATEEVAGWPGPKRELAAILTTIAWHESRFSLDVHAGRCRPRECDPDSHGRARARGLWQIWRPYKMPDHEWELLAGLDPESTRFSAVVAARIVVRSRRMCRSLEKRVDWPRLTFSAYHRNACLGESRTLPARVATFRRLLAITRTRSKS